MAGSRLLTFDLFFNKPAPGAAWLHHRAQKCKCFPFPLRDSFEVDRKRATCGSTRAVESSSPFSFRSSTVYTTPRRSKSSPFILRRRLSQGENRRDNDAGHTPSVGPNARFYRIHAPPLLQGPVPSRFQIGPGSITRRVTATSTESCRRCWPAIQSWRRLLLKQPHPTPVPRGGHRLVCRCWGHHVSIGDEYRAVRARARALAGEVQGLEPAVGR